MMRRTWPGWVIEDYYGRDSELYFTLDGSADVRNAREARAIELRSYMENLELRLEGAERESLTQASAALAEYSAAFNGYAASRDQASDSQAVMNDAADKISALLGAARIAQVQASLSMSQRLSRLLGGIVLLALGFGIGAGLLIRYLILQPLHQAASLPAAWHLAISARRSMRQGDVMNWGTCSAASGSCSTACVG